MSWFRRARRPLVQQPRARCEGLLGHLTWYTTWSGDNTYIERCATCGRERARAYQ